MTYAVVHFRDNIDAFNAKLKGQRDINALLID